MKDSSLSLKKKLFEEINRKERIEGFISYVQKRLGDVEKYDKAMNLFERNKDILYSYEKENKKNLEEILGEKNMDLIVFFKAILEFKYLKRKSKSVSPFKKFKEKY